MQAHEAGKAEKMVDEGMVGHLGLPAEAREPSRCIRAHLAPFLYTASRPSLAPCLLAAARHPDSDL